MKINLTPGSDGALYQWDTGQRVQVHGAEAGIRVDFEKGTEIMTVQAYGEDGCVYADIPDVLLQKSGTVRALVYVTQSGRGKTLCEMTMEITPRGKPGDYVFTEAERESWSGLDQRVKALEQGAAGICIGPAPPTDGTLYWLDTSGSAGEEFAVAITLSHATIDNEAETVTEGESFAATITPEEGYTLSSVTVTMGGTDITGTSYSGGNIYISAVTGDVTIVAQAVQPTVDVYTVTASLVNVTSNNSAVSADDGSAYTATLTAASGYTLAGVTVSMGGVDITDTAYADGVITIPAVTGNVVITATATEGVWETLSLSCKQGGTAWTAYSDDGQTQIGSVSGKGLFYSTVFSQDTEVKIALTMTGSVYSNIFLGSAENAIQGGSLVYAMVIPKVGGGYLAGGVFSGTVTVKSGHQFVLAGVTTNNATVEAWKEA